MADTPSVEKIQKDLEDLKCHIKTYSTGAYPAFFLQLHSVLKIQDILDMELADVYFCEEGQIKLLPEIIYAGEKIILDAEERKELAWYAMQRIPVCDTQEKVLNDWLCVNKQGKQLQMTAYRKLLERASAELRFRENYNVGYLHALYGYLAIAFGRKTVHEVAKEYRVSRYYLLNRIFKKMEVQFLDDVICQVANIKEKEHDGKNI
ncbi:Uncharacterised protein [Tyzzerella nexilis]|uniref:Uncharacterized protein n=1 Tax=[Clostridium] nexile TaxID=29361 RepID=A0A6N2VY70_9FIRM